MAKKKAKKKITKRVSRSRPWHEVMFPEFQGVLLRCITELAVQHQVTSRAQLHRAFREEYGSVSSEDFYSWLSALGCDDWFRPRPVVPSSVSRAGPQPRVDPALAGLGQPLQPPPGWDAPEPQIPQHPDVPGQLGLNGQPVTPQQDGYDHPVPQPQPVDDAALGLPSAASLTDGKRTVIPTFKG